jgi:hypothetical protein
LQYIGPSLYFEVFSTGTLWALGSILTDLQLIAIHTDKIKRIMNLEKFKVYLNKTTPPKEQ